MDFDAPKTSPQAAPATAEVIEAQQFLASLQARRPIVTWALLVTIFAVFGLEEMWGGSTWTLVQMGAGVPLLIRDGEWWRLLAPTLLHGGTLHVLLNGAVLYMLGSFIERLFGSARFFVLYMLSGLLGSVASALLSGLDTNTVSVGASGSLFGLLGASAVLGLWPRGRIPRLFVRDLRKNALINLGINILVSLWPNVDHWAHLGGALAGTVLVGTGLLQPTRMVYSQPKQGPQREGMVRGLALLCGVALYGSLGVAIFTGKPWEARAGYGLLGEDMR